MILLKNLKIRDIIAGNRNVDKVMFGGKIVWKKNDCLTFTLSRKFGNDSKLSIQPVKGIQGREAPRLDLKFSVDGGMSWNDYDVGDEISVTNIGDEVKFIAKDSGNERTGDINSNYNKIVMNGWFHARGNINSILYPDFAERNDVLPEFCYMNLFNSCWGLLSAPDLPSTHLSNRSYASMFKGCSSMRVPPNLPATHVPFYCYGNMFEGCMNMKRAPRLLARTIETGCYWSMFKGCGLEASPFLPAENLAASCYQHMFENCTSLKEVSIGYTGTFDGNFQGWLSGVSETGTIRYNGSDTTRGPDAIPNGWNVIPFAS